jgi:hypothetical protein
MFKSFLMLCFLLYRSIGVFLFHFVLPQCFVLLGIFKVFFYISFTHLLHLFGWDYFWLFFFVALTQSIVMAFFASRLVPSYFAVIFISQIFLLTTSYILLYNYFYIIIYYVYDWFLSCFATTFISQFILLVTPFTSLFLLLTRLHHGYSFLFILFFPPHCSSGLFLCKLCLFV